MNLKYHILLFFLLQVLGTILLKHEAPTKYLFIYSHLFIKVLLFNNYCNYYLIIETNIGHCYNYLQVWSI